MENYRINQSTVSLFNVSSVVTLLEDTLNQAERNCFFAKESGNDQALKQSESIVKNIKASLELFKVELITK